MIRTFSTNREENEMVRKTFVISLISALCTIFLIRPAATEVVNIPDANLRAAINETLNKKSETAAITKSEMQSLTELSVETREISDLIGLEHATNLTQLHLDYHKRKTRKRIVDVSPLANLIQLTELSLSYNRYIAPRGFEKSENTVPSQQRYLGYIVPHESDATERIGPRHQHYIRCVTPRKLEALENANSKPQLRFRYFIADRVSTSEIVRVLGESTKCRFSEHIRLTIKDEWNAGLNTRSQVPLRLMESRFGYK